VKQFQKFNWSTFLPNLFLRDLGERGFGRVFPSKTLLEVFASIFWVRATKKFLSKI